MYTCTLVCDVNDLFASQSGSSIILPLANTFDSLRIYRAQNALVCTQCNSELLPRERLDNKSTNTGKLASSGGTS